MFQFLAFAYVVPWAVSVAWGRLFLERPALAGGIVIASFLGFYAYSLITAPSGPGFYSLYVWLTAAYLGAGTIVAWVASLVNWPAALTVLAVGATAGEVFGWRMGEVGMGGEWGGFFGGLYGSPIGVFACSTLSLAFTYLPNGSPR